MTLPATPKGSWISKELKNTYGTKRWKAGKGVDLNGNGKLEKKEKIATYNTNKIPGNDKGVIGDWTDWLAFYRANYKSIHAKTRQNKNNIFFWAAKFKTTNPLHIITSIESPLVKQPDVLKAYKKTWAIIARARKIPVKGSTKLRLAKAKLLAVYTAMLKSGIKFKEYSSNLLVNNILDGKLDCDTSSFVMLTEGHEQGWPLSGVIAPKHFFVRWHDRRSRVRFNIDVISSQRFLSDREYKKNFKISSRSISTGVYLRNLKLSALIATALANRALSYKNSGRRKEAIRDWTQALILNPKLVMAHLNRGNTYRTLRKYTRAIKDHTKAINLDPKLALAYYNRGIAYRMQGKHTASIKDYTAAITINPQFVMAYLDRGNAYLNLSKHTLALKDYTQAIKINLSFTAAYFNRGMLHGILGNYTHAIKDFSTVIKLSPKDVDARNNLDEAYMKRGVKRVKAKNYAGAVSDFRNVQSKSSLVRYLIKKYTPCIRNTRRCP